MILLQFFTIILTLNNMPFIISFFITLQITYKYSDHHRHMWDYPGELPIPQKLETHSCPFPSAFKPVFFFCGELPFYPRVTLFKSLWWRILPKAFWHPRRSHQPVLLHLLVETLRVCQGVAALNSPFQSHADFAPIHCINNTCTNFALSL